VKEVSYIFEYNVGFHELTYIPQKNKPVSN